MFLNNAFIWGTINWIKKKKEKNTNEQTNHAFILKDIMQYKKETKQTIIWYPQQQTKEKQTLIPTIEITNTTH